MKIMVDVKTSGKYNNVLPVPRVFKNVTSAIKFIELLNEEECEYRYAKMFKCGSCYCPEMPWIES